MPFQSDAQRRFMYAKKPELAKKFSNETPKKVNLPERKAPAPTPARKMAAMENIVKNPRAEMTAKKGPGPMLSQGNAMPSKLKMQSAQAGIAKMDNV